MLEREPSRTALAAAFYRAAHQVLEDGRIFKDPLAVKILGAEPEAIRGDAAAFEAQRGIRFFVAARSFLAERRLQEGVETRGVGQLVVLGAGLDTFAYRSPFGAQLKIFEVDHPATQAWKLRRLREASIVLSEAVAYAPVDFEREILSDRLADAGLHPNVRTFFTWLGVAPYLTKSAVDATLSQIAAHPGGAEVVFDYGEPRENIDPSLRPQYEERAARVAAAGEPFLSYFTPADLSARLHALNFETIEDLDVPAIVSLPRRGDGAASQAPRRGGGHVIFAATAAR